MAMVKISNGEVTQIVSRGAFDTQYKRLGFQIVEDNKVAEAKKETKKAAEEKKSEVQVPDDDDFDADVADDDTEDDFEELLEKPISQWNKTEVKDFAAAKGIDIHGTKNANEAKEIIKKYLDDEAKKAAEA